MTDSHDYRTIICTNCGFSRSVPIYCGNRFCDVCGRPRRLRVRRQLNHLISNIPFLLGQDFKHLTLTIRNRQHLDNMVNYLVRSFRRLRQTRYWKSHVSGGAFVIEVTGAPGNWHAHIHAVVKCKWMTWNHLLKHWIRCSGGRGVYIQRIPKTEIIRYLTKYITKSEVSDENLETASISLKSFRLFQTFGTWHAIKLSIPKQPYLCPRCGLHCWLPFDVFYSYLDRAPEFNDSS